MDPAQRRGQTRNSTQRSTDIMAAMVVASSPGVSEAIETLCNGDGHLLRKRYYSAEKIREARKRTDDLDARGSEAARSKEDY